MTAHSEPVLFKDIRLTNVYGRIEPGQAEEVVRMWIGAGVLPEAEARRRCAEVVYTFHEARGDLIGVNTVYVAQVPALARSFYFYRTFIRAGDRGDPGLPRLAFSLTYEFLRQHAGPAGPAGLVVVTDNLKLTRRAVRRGFLKYGLGSLGTDDRGREYWYRCFDGSRIELPPAFSR